MEHQKTKDLIQDETLDPEQKTKAILKLHHDELNIVKEELKKESEALQAQLDEANKAFKQLKKENEGNESLQETIENHVATIKSLEKQIKESKIESAIELALTKAGARNVSLTAKAVERDLINIDKDGQIVGLEEQLKKLKESEDTSFLFKDPEETVTVEPIVKKPQPYQPPKGDPTKPVKTRGALLAERKKAEMQKSLEFKEKVIKGEY